MAAVFLGEKTLKQQSIEQALRRLKYLHTSLSPLEAGNNNRSQQKVGQFLRTKPLQPAAGDERVITIPQRTTAKEQCFLSLEPKTVKRSREKEKARVKLEKQRKKAVRTGRALLHSKTYEIAAPKTEEGKQFKTRDVKFPELQQDAYKVPSQLLEVHALLILTNACSVLQVTTQTRNKGQSNITRT